MMKEEKEIVRAEKVNSNRYKKKNNSVLVAIIFLIIGAAIMYLLVKFVIPIDNSQTIINKSEKEVTVTDTGIADAVEKLYDAVVVVEVYQNNTLSASGTGFVYKVDGKKAYILTNNHVVSSTSKVNVKVIFTNGNEEDVTIEGADEYSDLAVLSLSSDKIISVAEIGSSEDMRLGDTVFTCGAPLDTEYYWTVTRGVLSGKDRMVEVSLSSSSTSDYVMRVLQTDASINSGNSGGPLANSNGEVVGITNMKLVSSGVEGIGFAIPIEDAVSFADAIIAGESITRPLLGVSMINLSDTMQLYANKLAVNTELSTGVVVAEVQSGSPADKAGLQRGDIITALDDDDVKNVATLRYYLYKHSVGDTVTIKYERDGKTETAKVKLSVASE
jgi:serine protease Do